MSETDEREALDIIFAGSRDEDFRVELRGSKEAVKAAAALFGDPVLLVPVAGYHRGPRIPAKGTPEEAEAVERITEIALLRSALAAAEAERDAANRTANNAMAAFMDVSKLCESARAERDAAVERAERARADALTDVIALADRMMMSDSIAIDGARALASLAGTIHNFLPALRTGDTAEGGLA